MRSEIHLADLILAVQVLRPDADASIQIAALLGFAFVSVSHASKVTDVSPMPKQSRFEDQVKPKPRRSEAVEEAGGKFTVEEIDESGPVRVLTPLPEPFKETSEETEPSPKFFPLFVPIWTRAIITKLLSVSTYSGPPDIPKLIEIISYNLPLNQIPRRPLPSLRKGVQVLIDIGPGLVPYRRDQIGLLGQLFELVGKDLVQVWEFIGTPLKRAFPAGQPPLNGYSLPSPDTPLLMITDLGVAVPAFDAEVATTDDWNAFLQLVGKAGYQVTALTPYPPARCPDSLQGHVRIVQWDRGTSVSTILQTFS